MGVVVPPPACGLTVGPWMPELLTGVSDTGTDAPPPGAPRDDAVVRQADPVITPFKIDSDTPLPLAAVMPSPRSDATHVGLIFEMTQLTSVELTHEMPFSARHSKNPGTSPSSMLRQSAS